MADPTPALCPRLRQIELGGEGPPAPDAAPRLVPDAALPPEGYALRAGREGIEVAHADAAGRQ